ncbi:TRAP transporter small permease [Hydrogenophaga sp. 2FB]|uniref:TRAP transporter small permease n=1 Tax=Hydrogenophaga sp. 2FB TaxID=2502187 RepID=UPI0010F80203|nr:TRAP transporter small permease [Hydrogenophaga sp. 2FB]
MDRWIEAYFRLLKHVVVFSMAAMVVLVFANVVLRYAFNTGIPVAEELSRWLFVWLVFIGSAVALRQRAHIGLDSLVSRLPLRGKQACFLVSHVLMLLAVWLFLVGLLTQVEVNLATQAPATGLSMSVLYAAGLPFCLTAGVLLLGAIWRFAKGETSEDELIDVVESEENVLPLQPGATK